MAYHPSQGLKLLNPGWQHGRPTHSTTVSLKTGGVCALGVTMLVADYLSDRGANLCAVGAGFAVMLALILAFLMVALAGLAAFLTAPLVLTVAFVGILLALRYRFGVRSGPSWHLSAVSRLLRCCYSWPGSASAGVGLRRHRG